MQKIKYLLWIIIVAVLATFIYQNSAYFMAEERISLDLYFFEEFQSPEIPNIVYFLAVFLIGFLVALFLTFSYGYKKRKIIRELNEKINSDQKRIEELESKLAAAGGAGERPAGTGGAIGREKTVDAEFSGT